jgi:hypothetical protein
MRVCLSYFSLFLVALALMLLGADMIASLEMRGTVVTRSVGTLWDLLDPNSHKALMQWAASRLPGFCTTAINGLLSVYGWAVPGVLGVVLAFLFGRKKEEV